MQLQEISSLWNGEKMKYKALALDLDGTLINSEKKLSTKNKKAVMEAAERGVHIILASGRPLFGIEPVAEALVIFWHTMAAILSTVRPKKSFTAGIFRRNVYTMSVHWQKNTVCMLFHMTRMR